MENQEIEIKLYGRVQGINFRSMIKKKCINLKITGRLMNRNDGSVDIICQSTRENIEKFIFWLQKNPGFSKVTRLAYSWKNPSEKIIGFTIVRDSPIILDRINGVINLSKNIMQRYKKVCPNHIAIIPDGNRRWARAKGLAPQIGHYTSASFQHLHELFLEARRLGVKYLSIWGFSTENWKRNSKEIKAIFNLIEDNISQFKEEAHATKIRFRHIGRKDRLPEGLLNKFAKLEEETKIYNDFNVQLCLDYGGRDEIIRTINKIIKEKHNSINEQILQNHLDSYDVPDVDLIIRTSGEQRLSGFMPFQSVYAELYFTQLHFPDFNAAELRKAVVEFQNRQRRFGN